MILNDKYNARYEPTTPAPIKYGIINLKNNMKNKKKKIKNEKMGRKFFDTPYFKKVFYIVNSFIKSKINHFYNINTFQININITIILFLLIHLLIFYIFCFLCIIFLLHTFFLLYILFFFIFHLFFIIIFI